jgi:hypothetical protein
MHGFKCYICVMKLWAEQFGFTGAIVVYLDILFRIGTLLVNSSRRPHLKDCSFNALWKQRSSSILLSSCRLLSWVTLDCIFLPRRSPANTYLEVDLVAALTSVSPEVARGSAKDLFKKGEEQSCNDQSAVVFFR